MLGLYLYTHKNGHILCSLLSKFYELKIKKKLQSFMTNNEFWTKQDSNNKTEKETNKSRSEPGNAPRIGIGHREVVCQK